MGFPWARVVPDRSPSGCWPRTVSTRGSTAPQHGGGRRARARDHRSGPGGESAPRPPLPFWPVALLLNAVLVPFYLFGVHSGDSDTFYHLAGGRWMFEQGRLLDRETFSYTIAGRPWTNYYWAFEWLLFAAYRVAGMPGVIALRDVLLFLTANLFLYWVWRRTDRALPETLAFGFLVLPLYVPRAMNVRPYLFSYLFLLVAFVILDQPGAGAGGSPRCSSSCACCGPTSTASSTRWPSP